jgi:hypothetical protein
LPFFSVLRFRLHFGGWKNPQSAMLARVLLSVVVAIGARAQFAPVTFECGNNTLGSDGIVPTTLLEEPVMYFTFRAQALQLFEYRLIARDSRPLGWKEAYDFDAGDEDGANFQCFVDNTTDDTSCPNTYLANGQTLLIYDATDVNFGFQKCDDYDVRVHSQDVTLKVFARPIPKDVTPPGLKNECQGLTSIVPTLPQYCNATANGASATWHFAFVGAVISVGFVTLF